MKQYTTLYRNLSHLREFLEDYGLLHTPEHCVARIVTSNLSRPQIRQLTDGVMELLPQCQIIGMTSSTAVIHNSRIEEGETMISLEFYDTLRLVRHYFPCKDRDITDLAKEIYSINNLSSLSSGTVNILINSGFLYVTELLGALNQYKTPIQLSGAVVGIMPNDDEGFVFDEHGIYDDLIATFSFVGGTARHSIATNVSYELIQDRVEKITGIRHDCILEVDGVPAKDWLFNYLGITDTSFPISDELLTHFPIVLGDGSSSRFLHYEPETQEVFIHHETSLPLHTTFTKGCISPNFTLKNTHKSLLTMVDTPIESIFLCACFFRKIYLSNCIEWELKPFASFNICGMFAMGEVIFSNGKNILHHGASIFNGIAETEQYMIPQMEQLLDTQLISNATDHLHNLIRQAIPEFAEDIMFALSSIEHAVNFDHYNEYLDYHLNMPNLFQYKKDKYLHPFSRICVLEVESADAIIAFMGIDMYYDLCRSTMEQIRQTLEKQYPHEISFYSFNYKTMFFTSRGEVSEEDFIQLSREIHARFEHTSYANIEATVVLRFVVMTEGIDPLVDGIKFLYENNNNTETFLVKHQEEQVENSDIHIANMIKWALDNDKIIPYYQGLYHNEKQTIHKYEALMRIEDQEGKLYTPYHFMEVAKKYNLYPKISLKMIDQVLTDFHHREEKFSINLSLSDIQSEHFRTWFIERLQTYPTPQNITIEILESDDFKDNGIFLKFLEEVRQFGCKIAVDDFGTGYSTFMAISIIQPDYIKIDGSVIKHIAEDEKSRLLLDSMAYFAHKMNTQTVAEFVETKEIQDLVLQFGITYSQGYHFSQPQPLSYYN